MQIVLETPIMTTARVRQVCGLFDLPEESISRLEWNVDLPLNERSWQVGLITGPSGSGKSTVARHVFADALMPETLPPWPTDRAVLDGFPSGLSIGDVTELLSSVGLSSPPAWLRPYACLSTGQRFRCDLARMLAHLNDQRIGLFDEFTSVVDRTVARVGSAALARSVRRRGLKFVAVSCHEDIIDWLQPDWVFRPDANPGFAWRSLRRRPELEIDLVRCRASAWPIFAPHHYLSGELNRSAVCFLASHDGMPVAFSAWLNLLSRRGGRREHRTVVLPDWQGIGLGMAISSTVASMWKGLGKRATSTTSHPGFIAGRRRSPDWRMTRAPSLAVGSRREARFAHATTRLTAGFEYVGPAMDREQAGRLLG